MSRAVVSSALPASARTDDSRFTACARAFSEEFDHVYRALLRMGVRPVEAEDLAQDVFVVMWRRWDQFGHDRPLRPWLTGVASYVALDHFRKRSGREVAWGDIEMPDVAPGPEEQLQVARARAITLDALAQLPAHHRALIIRYYLDGRSLRQIAEEEGLPFFTACARLRRARLRFTKLVQKLQRGQAFALLTPDLVLGFERAVPAAPAPVRARVLARLAQGPQSLPPPRAMPIQRPPGGYGLPVAAGLLTVTVVLLVALMFARRSAPERAPSASAGPSTLPPPAHLRRQRFPARMPVPRLMPVVAEPPAERVGPADPLARGLVGHWRFDDAAGSPVARDSGAGGRTCLLHDADPGRVWVKGRMGGAIDLRGGGWLECPQLDEARVYDRALEEAEIAALASASAPNKPGNDVHISGLTLAPEVGPAAGALESGLQR